MRKRGVRMQSELRMTSSDLTEVQGNIERLAAEWGAQRAERQRRRHLDPLDFQRLWEAGFTQACLPVDEGGLWQGSAVSVPLLLDLLRTLARADASVALV